MYEADKAHEFLMGLNDESYSTVRSQILAMDPLPLLDKIFNIIQQGENHKKVVISRHNHGEGATAFAVKGHSKMEDRSACKICGRFSHDKAVCDEVIGYPPGCGTRGR